MSGGTDEPKSESELVSQVMNAFNVDEKTAQKIIAFANKYAIEKMKKWTKNFRRRKNNAVKR
jgi:hypothetical protein